jgi:endo-1,4-beta-xylanase
MHDTDSKQQIDMKSARQARLGAQIARILALVFAICSLAFAGALAKNDESTPDQLIDDTNWRITSPPDKAICKCLNFSDCFEFRMTHPLHPPDVEMTQAIKSKLRRGAFVKVSFSARTTEPHNTIYVVYHLTNPPFTKVWEKEIVINDRKPSKQFIDETIPSNYPGEHSLTFLLGKCAGRVELDDISVRVKALLPAQDPEVVAIMNAVKPDRVAERIKAVRTGILTVKVKDKTGQSVPNVKVEVKQLRHQFLFGCELGGLRLDDHSDFQRSYQKRFLDLFNYATLPCNWQTIEPTRGNYDFKRVDEMAKWCADHHIKTKGRALIENYFDPPWLQTEPAKAVPMAREWVTECIKHTAKSVPTWDVISDVLDAVDSDEHTYLPRWLKQEQKKHANYSEDLAKIKAATDVVASGLIWAKSAASGKDQVFILSENECGDELQKMLVLLEQKDGLPGGVGISSQMYQSKKRWEFDQLYSVSNNCAKFAPVHWTSVMVLSGDDKAKLNWDKPYSDWLSTVRGEADQSDYVEHMYRVLFSNPNIVSISWAELSDKNIWIGAPGGLLRRNGTAKPAYNKLMQLIHKEWWTNVPPGTTGKDGVFKAEPLFFGDYDIAITDQKGNVTHQQVQFRFSKDLLINL